MPVVFILRYHVKENNKDRAYCEVSMFPIQEKRNIEEQINKIIDLAAPYPMTDRLAFKIYRAYGTKSVERMTQNPYALARDVFGIGEQTATEIAKVIEKKLGKTFSPDIPTKATTAKHAHCGPGNGKLSPQNLEILKQKLQNPPAKVVPCDWQLHNPHFWTIPDLRRAVEWWFDVTWAHDSSYRNLLKKCNLVYNRKVKAFVPASALNGQ